VVEILGKSLAENPDSLEIAESTPLANFVVNDSNSRVYFSGWDALVTTQPGVRGACNIKTHQVQSKGLASSIHAYSSRCQSRWLCDILGWSLE
jgi:hypothetical protein